MLFIVSRCCSKVYTDMKVTVTFDPHKIFTRRFNAYCSKIRLHVGEKNCQPIKAGADHENNNLRAFLDSKMMTIQQIMFTFLF
jgi:hypothetical protein